MLSFMRIWLLLAVLTWNGYFLSEHKAIPLYVDLLAITAIIGRLLWHKFGMPHFFAKHPPVLSYFPLAYGMVLTEELYAALVNNIDEGYNTSLYLVRIGQFWTFNLLAFSGVIIALFLLHHFRLMRRAELTVLASLFGIYAEHAYQYLFTNPIVFVVYAPVTVFIYYLIFIPALSVLPLGGVRAIHPLLRYLISIVLIIALSIPFVLVIERLRTLHPSYFPPCAMIACSK